MVLLMWTSQSLVANLSVSVAQLKKKPADKTPCNYDQCPDGRMDLTIAFGIKEMTTPVYIKLDAVNLSEGVCRLLDIVII